MNKYINKLSVAVLLLASVSPSIALADTAQTDKQFPKIEITQETTAPSEKVNETTDESQDAGIIEGEEEQGSTVDNPKLPAEKDNTTTNDPTTITPPSDEQNEEDSDNSTTEPEKQYGTVTVRHIYGDGSIQPNLEYNIPMNEDGTYTTEPKENGKFHLIQIIGDAVGTFPTEGQHIFVTYIYSASDVLPPTDPETKPTEPEVKPVEPTTPSTDGEDVKQNPDNIKTADDKKEVIAEIKHAESQSEQKSEVKPLSEPVAQKDVEKKTLPETGVSENPLFIIFGILFIAVAVMGVWVVTKSSKK